MIEPATLFVYGTLRRAVRPDIHFRYLGADALSLGSGRVRGRLYLVSWYPALVRSDSPEDWVRGEVYQIAPARWPQLDEFEDCRPDSPGESLYAREPGEVRLESGEQIEAWAYFYLRPVTNLPRITSGDFLDARNLAGSSTLSVDESNGYGNARAKR